MSEIEFKMDKVEQMSAKLKSRQEEFNDKLEHYKLLRQEKRKK